MLIVSVATTMAMFGSYLHSFLNKDVKNEITYVITGEKESPEEMIDKNLGYMQLALSSINALDAMGDVTLDSAKTRAMWFVGLGTGEPAVTAGSMLLLYEGALALYRHDVLDGGAGSDDNHCDGDGGQGSGCLLGQCVAGQTVGRELH